MQWRDIDLVNKTIHVCKTLERIYAPGEDGTFENANTYIEIGTPKTFNSDRYIPILKNILPVIKKFVKPYVNQTTTYVHVPGTTQNLVHFVFIIRLLYLIW